MLSDEGNAARPAIVVSACLLGVRCNHRGGANTSPAVLALADEARLVPVCPEVAGGLPTPRPEARLAVGGRVVTADGADVTDAFERGAAATVAVASAVGARRAVLKARSPSCGSGPAVGVTAAALLAAGIEVVDEEHVGSPPTMERPTGA